jgi:hypothetical protein
VVLTRRSARRPGPSVCRCKVPRPSSPNHERRVRDHDPSRPLGLYYHLRYHLRMGVRRDSSGTNGTTTEQKAPRTGPNGTGRNLTEGLNAKLRIRRPQVRVLPSALPKVLQTRNFSSSSDELWRLIKLLLPFMVSKSGRQRGCVGPLLGSPEVLENPHS